MVEKSRDENQRNELRGKIRKKWRENSALTKCKSKRKLERLKTESEKKKKICWCEYVEKEFQKA